MNNSESDALVFFGATGDLAFKKIFPALQAVAKRGNLEVPVIGVGRSDWTADQLRARARESLEKSGEADPAACEKLCGLLRYVSVDYSKPETFTSACWETLCRETPPYLQGRTSRHANRVRLELFDHPEDARAARVIDLDSTRNRTGDVWHVWIEGIGPGQLYAYRVDGPYQPREARSSVILVAGNSPDDGRVIHETS